MAEPTDNEPEKNVEDEDVVTTEPPQKVVKDDPMDPVTDKYGILRSDRSWSCIFIAVLFFSIVLGLCVALVVTRTGIVEYYRPSPYVPPPILYSVDYLGPGIRYSFYENTETIVTAREICRLRNSTLVVLNDADDLELDCYLNSRNMAEHRNLQLWLNETVLFGGPGLLSHSVRYASYIVPSNVTHPDNISAAYQREFVRRGCDIAKDYSKQIQDQFNRDQRSNETVTYNLVKVFGNNGVRTRSTGDRQGCWHLIRSNVAATLRFHVICRSSVDQSLFEAAKRKEPELSRNLTRLFSRVYCN